MTTVVSTLSPTAPAPAAEAASDAPVSRFDLRLVSLLVVLLLLTQRIGIDVGGTAVSLAIPLAYAFVGICLVRHLLVISRLRVGLLAAGLAACLLATAAVSWLARPSDEYSIQSLLLLMVVYLPWVLRVRGTQGAAVVERAGRTFLTTMLVLAVAGMGQVAGQLAGVWEWQDYLQQVLPPSMYIPQYNFDNELAYGLGKYKGTAFVLLEPSFLSQYCALAILIGIMLRVRAWKLLVLIGGLSSAVSGTGLVLLAVGGVLLLLRAPRMIRPGYVLAGVALPAFLFFTPLGAFLVARQSELSTEGTSGNSRFVAPYQTAWDGLLAEPVRFLVGAGPGSVERVIPGSRFGFRGADVLYSIVPKLAFEYGIIAAGLMILFLVLSTVDRAPWRVVPASLVVMTFVLSGALLQPQTAVLVWLLAGIGATSVAQRDRPLIDRRAG
jgi:hypothetical protein